MKENMLLAQGDASARRNQKYEQARKADVDDKTVTYKPKEMQ